MNVTLTVLLVLLALGTLYWGFERYRTRFAKSDLFIAAVATVGLLAIAFAPAVYDWVGNVLNIRKRYVTVSLLANVALFAGLLYLVTVIRNTRARMNDLTRNLS